MKTEIFWDVTTCSPVKFTDVSEERSSFRQATNKKQPETLKAEA
jgi:hypothetical protein